ncbi:troponin C isoform X2 [Bombyx mori]|uniref:troponin C isoform X2 n=1 Tax=Bombyx mori TaxID=7091 RepID=UPI002ED45DF1
MVLDTEDWADELPPEQIAVLRKAFDGFDHNRSGSIPCDFVADILRMMGQPFNKKILEELIEEVDADKSGRLEFPEFVTLAAKFIVEEDAEAMQKELREAFRLYDKEGKQRLHSHVEPARDPPGIGRAAD